MICPHCAYTDVPTKKELFPDRFYIHPVDMIQDDASGGSISLYACPKCSKTFIHRGY